MWWDIEIKFMQLCEGDLYTIRSISDKCHVKCGDLQAFPSFHQKYFSTIRRRMVQYGPVALRSQFLRVQIYFNEWKVCWLNE